jgi:hypothetical protein
MEDIVQQMNYTNLNGDITILNAKIFENDEQDSDYQPSSGVEMSSEEEHSDDSLDHEIDTTFVNWSDMESSVGERVARRRTNELNCIQANFTEELGNIIKDHTQSAYTHKECCESFTALGRCMPNKFKEHFKPRVFELGAQMVSHFPDETQEQHCHHYVDLFMMN